MTGDVRVRLYKGHATVRGLRSPYSLYDQGLAARAVGCSEEEEPKGLREAASYAIKSAGPRAPWRAPVRPEGETTT